MTALLKKIDARVTVEPMTQFARYVGIDYSGAEAPVSRLRALQVYACAGAGAVDAVQPYDRGARNWCRKEVGRYLRECLLGDAPCIIGIDHGFAFPLGYFERHELASWDAFLGHFCARWRTDFDHMHVEFARRENPAGGDASELRLCERWTAGAKSVFHFDVQGSVAKSTHAGIPWLQQLRRDPRIRARTHSGRSTASTSKPANRSSPRSSRPCSGAVTAAPGAPPTSTTLSSSRAGCARWTRAARSPIISIRP